MKFRYSLLTLALVATIVSGLSAQTSWQWLNPKPQGNNLRGLIIKSDSLGIAVGDGGTVMRRVGGGFTPPVYPTIHGLRSVSRYVDTMYIVGDSGYIFKSVNNGETWANISYSASKVFLNATAARNKDNAWAAGDSGIILYTTNGGTSWAKQSNSSRARIRDLTWAKQTAYACGDSGTLMRGSFYGISGWGKYTVPVRFPLRGISMDTNNVYAVGDSGYILRHSFIDQNIIADTVLNSSINYHDVASWENYVVVVGSNGTIRRSNDTGYTWSSPASHATENINHVEFAPNFETSGVVWAVGDDGLFLRSANYGATWTRLDSGTRGVVNAVDRSPNGKMYGTSNAGIVYTSTNDGISWRRDSINVAGARLLDIDFDDNGFGLLSSYDNKVLRTLDSGKTWTVHTVGTSGVLVIGVSVDGNNALACGSGGKMYLTTNKGNTWTLKTSNTTDILYDVDLEGARGIGCGEQGSIVYSNDGGATWTKATSGTSARLQRAGLAGASAIGVVVAQGGSVLRSTNGGSSWSSVTSGTTKHLNDIRFRDDKHGLIVGDAGTILKTNNGGSSWKKDTSNTVNDLKGSIIIDADNAFVIGSKTTVLYTSNSMLPVELISFSGRRTESDVVLSWSVATENNSSHYEVFRSSDSQWESVGRVVAQGNSAHFDYAYIDANAPASHLQYRLKQYDLDGSEYDLGVVTLGASTAPIDLSLSVFPNPMVLGGSVSFTLPETSEASVSLVDISGRKASLVATGEYVAGNYTIPFDAIGISAGHYLLVLETKYGKITKNVIITK
ncbi:MAG TPA: YCF48-related protein [Candidatus Kapabacteria bacterium]